MKLIVKTFALLLFVLLGLATNAQNNSLGENKVYVLVLYVKADMNSFIRINCDRFAESFEKLLSVQIVANKDSLDKLQSLISNARFAKNNREIDVRRKFVYVSDEVQKITVCSDGRDIMIDSRLIKKNKRLLNFLESMCKP